MKIEGIRLKNFKAFRDVEIVDIPHMCVFIGANGTGKTTMFNLFSFLKDALKGLAQFEKFPASKALGELLESWHLAPFLDLDNNRSRSFSHFVESIRIGNEAWINEARS
jgi:AAA15 family ATPase/GTPase